MNVTDLPVVTLRYVKPPLAVHSDGEYLYIWDDIHSLHVRLPKRPTNEEIKSALYQIESAAEFVRSGGAA